jgi:hypothetical protein
MKISRSLATAATALTLVSALAGCSSTVTLEAAPQANNPACAQVSVRLPDQVEGLAKRSTDAQATGAWGNPAAVLLRCGLPGVTVSKLPCVSDNGVDWLVDNSKAPTYRFITFARNPATEVIVDSHGAAGVSVLSDLSAAIQSIPASKVCTTVSN